MTSAVLERDTSVRPKASLQLRPKRLALAALVVAAIAGSSWYGFTGGLSGASSRAPMTPMSAET
jgi:hypothetical protein